MEEEINKQDGGMEVIGQDRKTETKQEGEEEWRKI